MGAQAESPWKRDHPSTGVCRSRLHHAGGGASGSGTSEQIRLLERPGCQTRGPRAPHCVDAVITDPPYSSGGLMLSARQADPAVKYQNTGTVKTYPPDVRGQPGSALVHHVGYAVACRVLACGQGRIAPAWSGTSGPGGRCAGSSVGRPSL